MDDAMVAVQAEFLNVLVTVTGYDATKEGLIVTAMPFWELKETELHGAVTRTVAAHVNKTGANKFEISVTTITPISDIP